MHVSQDWQALEWASADLKGDREIVLNAVSQNGRAWKALRWASDELFEDQQIIEEITSEPGFRDEGLLLKVSLLSGRCCTGLFTSSDDVITVLRHCSGRLGLDTDQVVAMGKLVHLGKTEATGMISSMAKLRPGEMHLVTLVLSSH